MRRALLLLCIAVGAILALSRGPVGHASPADPAAALAAIDTRAAQVTHLRYGVLRTTTKGGTRSEERWRFAWEQTPGQPWPRLRVDYDGDTQRLVVCDGQVLLDYVPALRQARRFELAALGAERAHTLLSSVLEKVAVPGFRTGYDPRMAWSWESDPAGLPLAVGRDEVGGEVRFTLRADHAALLRSEIRQQGKFIVQIDAREHLEIAPGAWFPRAVSMRMPAEAGVGLVELAVTNLSTQPSPAALFALKLDPSVEVIAQE